MSQPEELSPKSLLDALYCEENDVVSDDDWSIDAPRLVGEDWFWEDDELLRLLSKQAASPLVDELSKEPSLAESRRRALDWMRRVRLHYAFSASTSVLGVDYLDRFVSKRWVHLTSPWMWQLAAVACLSLAAKMEEPHVPLLLDLQVGEIEYVFEAKTVQRMEMLVLSMLQWKMSPVTPLSFIDHVARRIVFADLSQGELLWRCETLLLCILYDSRIIEHFPSVVAGSVMLHAISNVDGCNAAKYQDQICDILGLDKTRMDDCSLLIVELASRTRFNQQRFEIVPLQPERRNGCIIQLK